MIPSKIGHLRKTYHHTLRLFPKFSIGILFVFPWDHSQEKLETMLIQNLGGQTKSILVFSKVADEILMSKNEFLLTLLLLHSLCLKILQ